MRNIHMHWDWVLSDLTDVTLQHCSESWCVQGLPLQAPLADDLQVTLHPTPGHGGTKYPAHTQYTAASDLGVVMRLVSTPPYLDLDTHMTKTFQAGAYPCCRDLG